MFDARMPPTAFPVALTTADTAEVASLLTFAVNAAVEVAVTEMSPAAATVVSSMRALVVAGLAVPMLVPSKASREFNSRF